VTVNKRLKTDLNGNMSRNKKGQFGKGNKVAKKKHKSIYVADAHTEKLPIEKKPTQINNRDFVPFGTNNLFPQRVSELNRKSAVSRSVVTSKRNYIIGQGFQSDNSKWESWTPNPDESARDLTNKLVNDKLIGGNFYIQIVKGRNFLNMFHVDHTTCRIEKLGKHVIVHPDWLRYESHKSLAITFPIYPDFETIDGLEQSIFHVKDYESEFSFYGIPSNIGAIDSANINYKTNKWNLSRLDNAFHASGVLMLWLNSCDFRILTNQGEQ